MKISYNCVMSTCYVQVLKRFCCKANCWTCWTCWLSNNPNCSEKRITTCYSCWWWYWLLGSNGSISKNILCSKPGRGKAKITFDLFMRPVVMIPILLFSNKWRRILSCISSTRCEYLPGCKWVHGRHWWCKTDILIKHDFNSAILSLSTEAACSQSAEFVPLILWKFDRVCTLFVLISGQE